MKPDGSRPLLNGLGVASACCCAGAMTAWLVFLRSEPDIFSWRLPYATVLAVVTAVLFSIPLALAFLNTLFEGLFFLFPLIVLLCFVPGALIDGIVWIGGLDLPVTARSWALVGGLYGGLVSPWVSKAYTWLGE